MPFDIETWKRKLDENLWSWRLCLEQAIPPSLYNSLCAATLLPLVQAAQGEGIIPIATALGSVAGSVGGNLLAEQIQRLQDQAEAKTDPETAVKAWIQDNVTRHADLRCALDTVLDHLEAISQAQRVLNEDRRLWFTQTLQEELASIGNLSRFSAQLTGSGTIAQGDSAWAVGPGGTLIGGDVRGDYLASGATKIVHMPSLNSSRLEMEARRHYLSCLRRHCLLLPLAALGGEEDLDEELTLDQVYIALNTLTELEIEPRLILDSKQLKREEENEQEKLPRLLTALEVMKQTPRLVLLGDPGAGKTTFVRQVIAWLAAAHMGETKVPSGLPADLLPILITLRDLAPPLADLQLDTLSSDARRYTLARAVRQQILADLYRWEAQGFAMELQEALTTGRCLLVLDGLDEVSSNLNERIREAVAAVIGEYGVQRMIVTCRVRSYTGAAILPNFEKHTLAPFDQHKIQDFAHAWYNAQKTLGRIDAQQAKHKATDLARAAQSNALRELAANPMMLTTLAIIHQREIRLPKERVCLYNLAVEVLLRRWQRGKTGEAGLTPHPALTSVLTDDRRLRPVVEGLAYEIHRLWQKGDTAVQIPRGVALTFLEQPLYLGEVGLAAAFLDYVDQRAGLLVGWGGEPGRPVTYSFLHHTFQEYLAACHLISQRTMARAFIAHASEGDTWDLVAQLAAEELLHNLRRDYELSDLAYRLCPEAAPTSTQAQRAVLWSANMAMLAGREAIERDTDSLDGGPRYLSRLLPRLVTLMHSHLTEFERHDVRETLLQLGTCYFRADAWNLLDEPLLGFIKIQAGPFLMGSDSKRDADASVDEQPQHIVILPDYYIARYPVTISQFWTFLGASGYKPSNTVRLYGRPYNYPVVEVSWDDARAYCDWLTSCLREWRETPEPLASLLRTGGWCISLPSEAEWEKAARGINGHRYPWGNDPDPSRANYYDTGIRTESAVGCFPGGISEYGVEDMKQNLGNLRRNHFAPIRNASLSVTYEMPLGHPQEQSHAPPQKPFSR